MAHRVRLSPGNGGWVRYQTSRTPVVAYVRYVDRDGQLVPVDLFMHGLNNTSLDTDVLRDITLGQIDAWVNTPGQANEIRYRMKYPGPDLRVAASVYATNLGSTHDGEPLRRHWLDDMYWSQVPDSGVPKPRAKPVKRLDDVPDEVLAEERDAAFSLAKLNVPAAKPFGDDFYRAVADAYSALSEWTRKPAAEIADRTGVDVVRVHKWIRVARQRGYLGAGRRGKVG